MREIKFRAKRKDNNEWCFGYLNYNSSRNEYYIFHTFSDFPMPVHKETIGQYTGFKDQNEKYIYDGDITLNVRKLGSFPKNNHMEVYFNTKLGHWELIRDPWDKNSNYFMLTLNKSKSKHLKVVGNIHDNPELL